MLSISASSSSLVYCDCHLSALVEDNQLLLLKLFSTLPLGGLPQRFVNATSKSTALLHGDFVRELAIYPQRPLAIWVSQILQNNDVSHRQALAQKMA